jgi:hypothetical protein
MADLDHQISESIAALQARGADRIEIAEKYQELCAWALKECVEAGERLPSYTSAEDAVKRLWGRLEPEVAAALSEGRITEVYCLELVRCEDGIRCILFVDSDDADLFIYASEDFFPHFDPRAWSDALASIAASIGAEVEVFDCYQDRVLVDDREHCAWTRVL